MSRPAYDIDTLLREIQGAGQHQTDPKALLSVPGNKNVTVGSGSHQTSTPYSSHPQFQSNNGAFFDERVHYHPESHAEGYDSTLDAFRASQFRQRSYSQLTLLQIRPCWPNPMKTIALVGPAFMSRCQRRKMLRYFIATEERTRLTCVSRSDLSLAPG